MSTILVAEDNEDLRYIIKDNLQKDGHTVIEACDGVEVSDLLANNSVDVLITDIVMPVQVGIETIIQIRKTYPRLPIIGISGGGPLGGPDYYLGKAEFAGADAVLSKPFSSITLRQSVDEMLTFKVST